MKKITILLIILLNIAFAYSQVGINTVLPTKDLDINGELRIRSLPGSSSTKLLTTDENGNISQGSYYVLSDLIKSTAANYVQFTPPTTGYYDNESSLLNLGVSSNVTVPAGKIAMLVSTYKVSAGTTDFPQVGAYVSIRFHKDGSEVVEASTSSRLAQEIISGSEPFQVATLAGDYYEIIDNTASATDLIVNYSLHGYIEQWNAESIPTYRFNMWDNPPANNYGYGYGNLRTLLYLK